MGAAPLRISLNSSSVKGNNSYLPFSLSLTKFKETSCSTIWHALL